MAYGRFRRRYKSRRRTRASRISLRRRFRRSARRWRRYYNRRRRRRFASGTNVALSIYSNFNGLKPHYIRRKTVFPICYEQSYYTLNDDHGDFTKTRSIDNYGDVTIFYLGFNFFMNFSNLNDGHYGPQYTSLFNYFNEYRWWKFTGIKITFTPRINTVATPIYGQAGAQSSNSVTLAAGYSGFGQTTNTHAASIIVGSPVYDGINRQTIGFAVPFLGNASKPWQTSVSDINKYYESGYKRLRFIPGRPVSIYYRCYGGTADNTGGNSAPSASTLTDQIITGWRPTILSNGLPMYYDEQGLAVMVPLDWIQLTIRYTISVTIYTKFLFYKGTTNT